MNASCFSRVIAADAVAGFVTAPATAVVLLSLRFRQALSGLFIVNDRCDLGFQQIPPRRLKFRHRCRFSFNNVPSASRPWCVPAPNGLQPRDVWRARLQKSLYCGFVATRRNLPCNHELHFVSPSQRLVEQSTEPGAVYITVLKYGALSWEDKSETPTNTSGRAAFTHPTKNGCLVTT